LRLRAAAIATGEPSSSANSTLATTALDKLANDWLDARSQACADTRERRTQPEALLQLRLACFDRQKENLDALIALLEKPDRATVKQATRAVRQLQGPNECANAHALSYIAPPAPVLASRATELRKQLSRANALKITARAGEAIKVAEPLVTEARHLGYQPLLAEALYTLEVSYATSGDFTKSDLLDEAGRAAVASHAYGLMARVAAERYWVEAVLGRDAAMLREWHERAHDWVEREGDLEAQVNCAAADALDPMQRGDYATSIDRFARAIELDTQLYGADSISSLALTQNRALALDLMGRYDEAASSMKSAVEQMQRNYGDDSDDLASALDIYATILSGLGRYDEASNVLDRALGMQTVAQYTRGSLQFDLARVYTAAARFDDALVSCDRGFALDKKAGIVGMNLAINEDSCAAAYLGLKRFDDALKMSQRCVAEFRKNRDHDAVDMVHCLAVEGATLVELGKPSDASTVLEQALALQKGNPAGPGVVANLQYQLARALVATKGDRARARDLVDKARDELAKYPFRKPLLDEVDSWRAKHAVDLR
jgi:tetratricopeptide (TPR) repeat protein